MHHSLLIAITSDRSLAASETEKNTKCSLFMGCRRKLSRFSREQKAAKTLGIVMGVFIICWMPFFTLNVLTSVFKAQLPEGGHHIVFAIFTWLGYLNSGCNPIIYAFNSRDFRRAFFKILCPERLVRARQRKQLKACNSANEYSSMLIGHHHQQKVSLLLTADFKSCDICNTYKEKFLPSENSKSKSSLFESYDKKTMVRVLLTMLGFGRQRKELSKENTNVVSRDQLSKSVNSEHDKSSSLTNSFDLKDQPGSKVNVEEVRLESKGNSCATNGTSARDGGVISAEASQVWKMRRGADGSAKSQQRYIQDVNNTKCQIELHPSKFHTLTSI